MIYDLSPKEQVIDMLQRLPDDLGFEDIQYHIHVLKKLNLAERDSRTGRVYTQAEIEERMKQWLTTLEQEQA